MPVQRWTITMLLLATLAPARALAQQEPPESVPMELARALIPAFMLEGRPAEILVGRVPDGLSAVMELPDGVRVVGSIVFRRATHTVVAIAAPAQPVLDELAARLRAAGWAEGPRFQHYGFVSSVAVEPTVVCSEEGEALYLMVQPCQGEEELATIRHMQDPRLSPCEVTRQRFPVMHGPMPALLPPDGVRVSGSRVGGGDEVSARGLLSTELGVGELARHYADQLREHGWRSASRAAAPDLVVETWQVEDDEGAAWHGMLVVTTLPEPGSREAFLRVHRMSEP